MECKATKILEDGHTVRVLIETLWNVKVSAENTEESVSLRINRNIVECKVSLLVNFLLRFVVLIETLWNVKISDFASRLLNG